MVLWMEKSHPRLMEINSPALTINPILVQDILDQLHRNTLNRQTLYDALLATAKKRGTERHLAEAMDVLNEVESSPVMQKLWESYRRKFSYAADLEWSIIMGAVRSLYALCEKGSSL